MTHTLPLMVSQTNWRLFMLRKSDPGFAAFEQKVFARDHHTCQYCGFRAQRYMDVVNQDGDYRNNTLSNLTTSCCFCSQNFFIDSVGRGDVGGGLLIVMPQMTQGELNGLCHSLFTAIFTGSVLSSQARTFYRTLKLRGQKTEKMLGEGMSQPQMLGRLLADAQGDQAHKIQQQLQQGLRLLPDIQGFAVPIKAWIEEAMDQVQSLTDHR